VNSRAGTSCGGAADVVARLTSPGARPSRRVSFSDRAPACWARVRHREARRPLVMRWRAVKLGLVGCAATAALGPIARTSARSWAGLTPTHHHRTHRRQASRPVWGPAPHASPRFWAGGRQANLGGRKSLGVWVLFSRYWRGSSCLVGWWVSACSGGWCLLAGSVSPVSPGWLAPACRGACSRLALGGWRVVWGCGVF
jgi:hypothetical protein